MDIGQLVKRLIELKLEQAALPPNASLMLRNAMQNRVDRCVADLNDEMARTVRVRDAQLAAGG